MDNRFDRLEQKLDKIDSRLDIMDQSFVKYNAQLEYHIKRSDNIEDYLTLLEDELKPIQQHVNRVDGALKLLGALAIGIGAILAVLQIFKIV